MDDAHADASWKQRGACRGLDPAIWYPEAGASSDRAKAICHSCVVEQSCLEAALASRERYGVWGGTSEKERRRILRQRNGARPNMARAARRRRSA